MSFLDTPRFPDDISYGSRGGPAYQTRIVQTASGYEQRNAAWAYPLHRYEVVYGVKTRAQMEALLDHFHAVAGRAHGFRFKDWADYQSCPLADTPAADDQALGTGDGATLTWQLKKTYIRGSLSQARLIRAPVSGSVLLAVAGIAMSADWTVSTTTGIVTFENRTPAITSATNANPAVLTVGSGHNIATGSSVQLSGLTGGTWNTLNGNRYAVTAIAATTITINLDSTSLGTLTAGTAKTLPQSGEAITAGYQFDVPVRFDSDYLPTTFQSYEIDAADVALVEIRT